jgi:hypothetical protein
MDHAGESLSHWSSVHLARLPLPRHDDPALGIDSQRVELLCGRSIPSPENTWGPPDFTSDVMDKRFWVRASRKRQADHYPLNRCSRCFKRAEKELETPAPCYACDGRLPCSGSGPCGGTGTAKPKARSGS